MNRRDFILNSGKGVFATAALASFPASIQKALAIDAKVETGSIQDVKHVVILTQENRSFDNYFGTLKGVRGFGDRFTIPLSDGRQVWQQYDEQKNKILPYHLDSRLGNAQRVSGTPHSWSDGQAAWNCGRMGDWVAHKRTQSMGYFKQQEVEYQFALANAFTICDAYHCSMHAGTNPNRKFIWTGSNGPKAANVASVVNEFDAIGSSQSGYHWKTYPERLQEAGISWKVYQNMPDNFTDNPLAGFKQYRLANERSGKPVSHSAQCPPYDESIDAKEPLYKGIANTMPDQGFLASLKQDIAAGKLPQVSWIIAPAAYSEHPGPSSPVQGAWYTQELVNALTENPEIWSQTVLFINFDENDGFFDHMPSPSAPSRDIQGVVHGKTTLTTEAMSYEYFDHQGVEGSHQPKPDGGVYGPGVRVPMYVLSPWSRGGWVNSEVFDHTSVIQFLETRFGVQEPNISPYRRAVCGDLSSAFNFKTPNNSQLPVLAGQKTKLEADRIRQLQESQSQVSRPVQQQRPEQQLGIRPSRALPYILHCSALVDAAQQQVKLMFSNTGRAAAVFHVYNRKDLNAIPKRYMVEANKQLDDIWVADHGEYDLWVLGPNGFHRSFKGNLNSAIQTAALPEIRVCMDECNKLYLKVRNDAKQVVNLKVKANAYFAPEKAWEIKTAAQEQELYWDMTEFGGWYDFSVTLNNDSSYQRRFAGRLETEQDSISDPYMGYIETVNK
ncbi:phosphocholine-specific phospholipase C [Acinetobacter rudis]|uniref:Phospholipase C, phosphocholine-specific n=1 Tax=Acinetobacter rudis TaxID=632955 RepID=A0AAW8J789_9GAMM|nr:phospholipase C, phosphocholine-specific [Acinetobacter rudis]MDQ8935907.1 phospholipase C, phosphocholine-specific [Acinetobacter rudis]MDQ8953648.1 phospholipase C, phosphocholine-specific [Acinetobacter rudis]MDQ9018170.1 phospholipase C, phosphocholine-specific [Acinetobacter rudis]